MPKLNVQQNNANVIKALRNALAIGQIKGPIASDGADNFSSAGSNRNFLDNPWFTVNQRQVANGVNINANGFVADRWQATGTIGATRNSDGSLTIADTLFHKLPTDLELAGKTVTLSVLYADGTTEANTFPWSGTSTKYFTYGRAVVYASAYQINFNTFTKDVKAFKLEVGSVSTLANDAPPDYGTELVKCMRYAWLVKTQQYEAPWFGFAINTATVVFDIVPPVPMRAGAATFAVTGTFYISQNGGAPVSCTIGAINAIENGNLRCSTSGTFTSTTIATIYTSNNAPTILISRDL